MKWVFVVLDNYINLSCLVGQICAKNSCFYVKVQYFSLGLASLKAYTYTQNMTNSYLVDSRQISLEASQMLLILDLNIYSKWGISNTNMIWHDQFCGLTRMWPTLKDQSLWLPFNHFEVQLKGNDSSEYRFYLNNITFWGLKQFVIYWY